jgi:beta-glucosidase
MVLMRNEKALPFAENVKNVALYGNTSYDFIAGGTGSGNVNHAYVVSLLDGLKNGGYSVSEELKTAYESYLADAKKKAEAALEEQAKKDPKNAMLVKFLPQPLPAEKLFTPDELAKQAEASDIAVITLGRLSGEFLDRKVASFL